MKKLKAACYGMIGTLASLTASAQAAEAGRTPMQMLADRSGSPEVLVIAHRGCWGEAPEVSVAAIEACTGIGVHGVEVDVRKTRDGALVLIHDETVDRTTNGTGAVADMTLAEIKKLRLRKGPGGPSVVVTDEPVPTLEEGLKAAKGRLLVHLHLKTASHDEVAQVVRRLGMQGQAMAWMNGGPADPGHPQPAVSDALALIPIIEECGEGSPPSCKPVSPAALNGYARFRPAGYFANFRTNAKFLREMAAAPRPEGTRLSTESLWRVDNAPREERHKEWRAMLDGGVSLILTDQPADLMAFLRSSR